MPSVNLGELVDGVYSVKEAVEKIIPYLEDSGRSAHKAIYFDGWDGLAASAVLRAIAEHPPPSLRNKFDRIIHIDCSRWKSRRAIQRAIADELKLPQRVMDAFKRQDVEDDFSGVDEDSRAEIAEVTREIYQTVRDLSCLVIFHNGSNSTVDLSNFGFPQFNWFSPYTVLWTFRGRLRLNPEIKEKVDSSHLYLYKNISWGFDHDTRQLILEEATEIAKYTQHKSYYVTPEIATKCVSYLLWLNKKGGNTMDYNWATHASNYWVCDGIIGHDQFNDDVWEVSAALHKQIRTEECSSHSINFPDGYYTEHWMSVIYTSDNEEMADITLPPKLTSFFLVNKNGLYIALPREMFQQLETLHVLKLSWCSFSFCSPPFQYCRSLRFLGLHHCKDLGREEEDKQGRPIMVFFQSLWVLDISHTDWELDLSQDIVEQLASNIREVHVNKGRIWKSSLAWRQLQKLRKLLVTEPTSSWETGKKDEFAYMEKLELLHLSGNNSIQVLPSLCGAIRLKTLVLDGCVGLEHVGPEGIPPALETFSLDGGAGKDGNNPAKISRITLVDCAKLVDFTLCGSLPNLEELELSCTTVKTVNLKKVVQVEKLERILLMGCYQLRAIVWPKNGMKQLRLLQIDTRQGVVLSREASHHFIVCQEQEGYCHAHVSITDMRFLQSLVLTGHQEFCWSTAPFKLNLYLSCAIKDDGKNCSSDKAGHHFYSTGQIAGSKSVVHKSLISNTCNTYNDVSIEQIPITEDDDSSALQFEPQDLHVEMGQEMVDINVPSLEGIKALYFVMNRVQSLHLHDNCNISSIIPEHIASTRDGEINYRALKWCRVEKCPKLDIVFHTNYDGPSLWFDKLETFWAADLLMARSIWSRGRIYRAGDRVSFAKLRAIHLYRCPRLTFVLPLSWFYTLSSLETLHIIKCSDLRQVFPVEAEFLNKIATEHPNGVLEFPRLKDLYLYHLSSLRQICEAKMFAPKLETVRLRGCWGLKRLPATSRRRHGAPRVIVDCEKDWWDSLEWDGLDFGHHPSLFAPSHSSYYKKRMLRATVLR